MKKISALAIAGVFAASLAGTAFAEMADVKVSGEVRVRDEWTNNKDFNANVGDNLNMIVQRTRVNVDAKVDERVKAYVSLENNRNWGSGKTAPTSTTNSVYGESLVPGTANDTVSLYEGYVVVDKLFDQPLQFKAGRQKIALGNQRLVGANDWNAGQAFDAWILGYNNEAVSANLASVTLADNNSANTNANIALNLLYVTVKSVPVTSLDLYAMQFDGGGGTGTLFNTYGVRANGAAANIDWDAELALQSGDSSTGVKKDASALWVVAGYTIPQAAKLRVGAEYDSLSGKTTTDTDDKAFTLIAPTYHSNSKQHSNYGITDIVEKSATAKTSGLNAMSVNVSAQPLEGLQLLAEYWNFSSAQEFVSAAPGGAKSTKLGNEVNLQAWYAITKSTDLHAYYAQFTPGDQAAKTDAETDAVLQLCVKF